MKLTRNERTGMRRDEADRVATLADEIRPRLQAFMRAVRKETDVDFAKLPHGCCATCYGATEEGSRGIPSGGWAFWFLQRKGSGRRVHVTLARQRADVDESGEFFYHEGMTPMRYAALQGIVARHGFELIWDGSDFRAIEVRYVVGRKVKVTA